MFYVCNKVIIKAVLFVCRRQKLKCLKKLDLTYSLTISSHRGDGTVQGVGVGVEVVGGGQGLSLIFQ